MTKFQVLIRSRRFWATAFSALAVLAAWATQDGTLAAAAGDLVLALTGYTIAVSLNSSPQS